MNRMTKAVCVVRHVAIGLTLTMIALAAATPDKPGSTAKTDRADALVAISPLPSVGEARERAKILHETIHDTLQIVHSQYYREDEGLELPASALKQVFQKLAVRRSVEIRWLVVDAKAMNVDHNPRNDFEKQAVKAFGSGKDEFELVSNGVYRHAGLITLSSECLKCHMPNRTSNKSRAAGLVIAIPIEK